AGTSALVVCAICLGRHTLSDVKRCNAVSTWDGHPTTCTRQGNRIVTHQGLPLCTNWQRDTGCSETGHDERHRCSGCGSDRHGAHRCPRAQKE
ncbi:hypothetical protein BV20DRAFT_954569, partial [Pilatotrama ljubarskyi]